MLKKQVANHWRQYTKAHLFYTFFGVGICAAYCLFLMVLSMIVAVNMPPTYSDGKPRLSLCSTGEVSRSYSSKWVTMTAIVVNLTSVVVYLAIFVMLRMSAAARHLESVERIYKSLCVIMLFELVGWGSNSVYQQLSEWHVFRRRAGDEYTVWCLEQALSYLLVLATAVNAPVLFFFSEIYRKAFVTQWKSIQRWRNRTVDLGTSF
ncbi:hypothetical protein AAVH_12152 [Aphelenchoides avenae]|nr:hypothetical protein AAVH_12152 [Aphelenchus avenae]